MSDIFDALVHEEDNLQDRLWAIESLLESDLEPDERRALNEEADRVLDQILAVRARGYMDTTSSQGLASVTPMCHTSVTSTQGGAMKVIVVGPNLIDQSKGQYHCHAAGCADLKKAQYQIHREDLAYPVEVSSIYEVVDFVYRDFLDEDGNYADDPSYGTWEDIHEIAFFPCTDALPRTNETQEV